MKTTINVFSLYRVAVLSFLILFAHSTLAETTKPDVQFLLNKNSITIQPEQITEVILNLNMPKGFHAYTDQFKVQKITPDNFKVGALVASPEVEFFDKFSKKNRKGLFEKGELKVQIEAPEKLTTTSLNFEIKYQICSEQVCFLPQAHTVRLELNPPQIQSEAQQNPAMSSQLFPEGSIENQLSKNFVLTYFLVFLAGLLTSFTPCIFPMIPITISILGSDLENKTRAQSFIRSLFYVLGIALTYSVLGVIAALTGSIFGKALTSKWVLTGLVILFFTMALSMWGAFELQLPAFIRNKFGAGKSTGYSGAFGMGLVAGLVASPCVGPVLVSILSFVSTTQNIWLGFTLLFTFAVGLGLLFIAIGLSGQLLKKLPKSGPWMEFIKFVLGFLMYGASLYYLKLVIPFHLWLVILSLSLVAISYWQGAFRFKLKQHPLKQFLLILIFASSFLLSLISLVKYDLVRSVFESSTSTVGENKLVWQPYSQEVLASAVQQGKPVLIDFFAEWCGACHELEEKTFSQPEFREISSQFVLVKLDATEDTPQVQEIINLYNIKGLPTVMFINKKGQILNELTFTQFLSWNELKPKMLKVLEDQKK